MTKITNNQIRKLLKLFKRFSKDPDISEEIREFFLDKHDRLLSGALEYEDEIERIRSESIRNPAFAGDFIGYPGDEEDRYSDGYCPKCGMPWLFYHDDDGKCFDD